MSRFKLPYRAFILVSGAFIIGVWFHLYSLDGLDGAVLRLLSNEETVFSESYTDQAFRKVKKGMSKDEAIEILGEPIRFYLWFAKNSVCIEIENDSVKDFWIEEETTGVDKRFNSELLADDFKLIEKGITVSEVKNAMGVHQKETLKYSESPSGSSYRERIVILERGKVIERLSSFYAD